jgi:hypothetical protein
VRRSRLLVVAASSAVLLAGVTQVSTATAATSHRVSASPIHYVGQRAALTAPAASATAKPPSRSAAPDLASEIKNSEVGSDEAAPQGGAAVGAGTVGAPEVGSARVSRSTAGVVSAFEGSNHFDSRYSGAGNQFSGEPPDQGMCVGPRSVFEIVNSVVQVYTKSGQPMITGTRAFPDSPKVGLTINEFYGRTPEFVRPDGPYGGFMFDTSCLYDPSTQRWFVTSASLDQDPVTGDFTGPGQVWLAVSDGADPLGAWSIWSIDTTNNGTNGTPDHHCDGGYCFGDYPQIGMDANGFYLTTNEFEMFADGYNGGQLYALSKSDLVAGTMHPTMQLFENVATQTYQDVSYSLQPVNALPADWDTSHGGSMYFGMSGSPYADALARSIVLYGLHNTASLNGSHPNLTLHDTSVRTKAYAVPGYARQKNGPMPFLNCANTPACIGAALPRIKSPSVLDGGTGGKVTGAWLHDGAVYLVAGTALAGTGAATYDDTNGSWHPLHQRIGVIWFALRPGSGSTLTATRVANGYLAVNNANLTYPTIVVGPTGAGAIGATLTGPGYYPSAAVARFAPGRSPWQVQITGRGAGPQDGFTPTALGGYRPRWGDYGAAAVTPDGTMWLANEYIAARCGNAEYSVDSTCGYTRTALANWSTHITGVSPRP